MTSALRDADVCSRRGKFDPLDLENSPALGCRRLDRVNHVLEPEAMPSVQPMTLASTGTVYRGLSKSHRPRPNVDPFPELSPLAARKREDPSTREVALLMQQLKACSEATRNEQEAQRLMHRLKCFSFPADESVEEVVVLRKTVELINELQAKLAVAQAANCRPTDTPRKGKRTHRRLVGDASDRRVKLKSTVQATRSPKKRSRYLDSPTSLSDASTEGLDVTNYSPTLTAVSSELPTLQVLSGAAKAEHQSNEHHTSIFQTREHLGRCSPHDKESPRLGSRILGGVSPSTLSRSLGSTSSIDSLSYSTDSGSSSGRHRRAKLGSGSFGCLSLSPSSSWSSIDSKPEDNEKTPTLASQFLPEVLRSLPVATHQSAMHESPMAPAHQFFPMALHQPLPVPMQPSPISISVHSPLPAHQFASMSTYQSGSSTHQPGTHQPGVPTHQPGPPTQQPGPPTHQPTHHPGPPTHPLGSSPVNRLAVNPPASSEVTPESTCGCCSVCWGSSRRCASSGVGGLDVMPDKCHACMLDKNWFNGAPPKMARRGERIWSILRGEAPKEDVPVEVNRNIMRKLQHYFALEQPTEVLELSEAENLEIVRELPKLPETYYYRSMLQTYLLQLPPATLLNLQNVIQTKLAALGV